MDMTPTAVILELAPPCVFGGAVVALRRFRLTVPRREWLAHMEWTLAAAMTAIAGYRCALFAAAAGALWRDEANSAALVALPTLGAIWHNLDSDSFPMLWLMVLRAWAGCGLGQSDLGLRAFGLLVAVLVISAALLTARNRSIRVPFLTLMVLCCNPITIRCIAANRAYGLGVLLLIIAYHQAWLVACRPSGRNIAAFAVLAGLAAHCLYYNIIFVWSFALGAASCLCLRHERQRALLVGLIAGAVTVSMLVYLPAVSRQRDWSPLVASPTDLGYLLSRLADSIAPSGISAGQFAVALLACVWWAIRSWASGRTAPRDGEQGRCLVYAPAAALAALVGSMAFLLVLQYRTSPWYYVPLICVLAVTIDSVAEEWAKVYDAFRLARFFACAAGVAVTFGTAQSAISTRQTNLDITARYVAGRAYSTDLIVVTPWYYGTVFRRYYHGTARWVTMPPMHVSGYGGMSEMKRAMMSPQPMAPLKDQAAGLLKTGRALYLVGAAPPPQQDPAVTSLPPAGAAGPTWHQDAYMYAWYHEFRAFLSAHSRVVGQPDVTDGHTISGLENAPVEIWRGWSDKPRRPGR